MTTIVASKEMMVADTQGTDDGMPYRAEKLFKVKGSIIGFGGSHADGLAFIEWYKDKRKSKPTLDDDFQSLVLCKGVLTSYDNGLTPMPVHEDYIAIGTGRGFAIGAMDAGKTPIQAVKIACKRDTCSGLPVEVFRSDK